MLKILGKLPQEPFGLALSGGIDSMTIANFLLQGNKGFTAFHFNHGTPHGEQAEKFVVSWCTKNKIHLVLDHIDNYEEEYSDREWSGPQEWYRWVRYMFFKSHSNHNIILAHHLDDVLETWLFSSFHGNGKLIPYKIGNCIRPFLLTSKDDIKSYAIRNDVKWIEDSSNAKNDYMRNRIRNKIVPEIEIINPGIRKHIARMVNDMYNRYLENEPEYWRGY